jgi:transcription initiation factor TFIID subunit 2
VTIHLPPTPVLETPPPLPAVKVSTKPQRPVPKTGGPPGRSPLVPFAPPKLKLPRISSAADVNSKTPVTEQVTPRVAFATPKPVSKSKGKPPKSDKNSHVPKAQTGGMSLNDLRACRNALKKIKPHKHAALFLEPVDPVRNHAPKFVANLRAILLFIDVYPPSYFEVIKNPMDLSTMTAKLDAGMYKDRFAFEADFALMISNAKQYNVAGSFAHNEAIAMETLFEKRKFSALHTAPVIKTDYSIPDWSRINKTLEVANKASQLAAASAEDAPVASSKAVPLPPEAAAPIPPQGDGPSTSIRPTIKFKPAASDTPKAAPKPRAPRKPKVIDVLPPPYIDDGSHDLLQEVIAIEQETKEKRRRSTSEKDLLPEKRKRFSPEEDDDILALAAPISSKRKNSGLSSASTLDALEHVLENGVAVDASPPPLDSPPAPPAAHPSKIRISLKGKEREVVPSPSRSDSKPSKSPPTQATPLNEKKCREVLKALFKFPEAFIFSQPVDPEKDGCPT